MKALAERPALNIYSQDTQTELHTDTSAHGSGAVLKQKHSNDDKMHPIYFMSKTATPAEKLELEVLVVVYALKKFRIYLHGLPF